MQDKVKQAQEQNQELAEGKAQLIQELQADHAESDSLKQDAANAQTASEHLAAENERLKEMVRQYGAEVGSLRAKASMAEELQTVITQATEKIDSFNMQNRELSSSIEQLQAESGDLTTAAHESEASYQRSRKVTKIYLFLKSYRQNHIFFVHFFKI